MALDFPASPTNGQTYGAYVYDSSLPGWRSKGGAVAATYVSDTAPSGAVKGDMWYRSSDGTTYVYYVDADTSQWVEIRSEIATSKVGLVPIIPTSVTVSTGTASVAANGTITYSGVNTLDIIGVFSSTYRNYRLVAQSSTTATPSEWQYMQYRTDSSHDASATYQSLYSEMNSTGGPNAREVQFGATASKIWPTGNYFGNAAIDFYAPNIALFSTAVGQTTYCYAADTTAGNIELSMRSNTSYTGIRIFGAGMSGIIRFYGYN